MWNRLSDDAKRNYAKALGAIYSLNQAKRRDYASSTPYDAAPRIRVSANERIWAAMPSLSPQEIDALPKNERKAARKKYARINRAKNKVIRASQYEARRNAQHARTIEAQRAAERRAMRARDRDRTVFGTRDVNNAYVRVNVLGDTEWVESVPLEDLQAEVAEVAADMGLRGRSRRLTPDEQASREARRAERARQRRLAQDRRRGDVYGRRERQRQLKRAMKRNAGIQGTAPITMDMMGSGEVEWWGDLIGTTDIGAQYRSLTERQRYWLLNATGFMRLVRDNFDIRYNAREHRLELTPAHAGEAMGAVLAEMRDWMTVAREH